MLDESTFDGAQGGAALAAGLPALAAQPPERVLRLGFLGLGWIGLNRLESIREDPGVEIAAIADPDEQARAAAVQIAPAARLAGCLEELLGEPLDGLVIATPSALHAEQTCAALRRGLAVFCQKPLARNGAETQRVVDEAMQRDRLLGVDYCYRHLAGMAAMRDLIQGGELGRLFAVDLTFHNAYGPDKSWFYDVCRSGGGCLMDLGTHLVDLALWMCDYPAVSRVSSQLYRDGAPLEQPPEAVEDAAFAHWLFDGCIQVRLACSWRLSAGRDAEISAAFYGHRGAAVLRNVDGSFYDFVVEHNRGTQARRLASPPDAWGGRALSCWARQLARGRGFDPAARHYVTVAKLLDGIYGR